MNFFLYMFFRKDYKKMIKFEDSVCCAGIIAQPENKYSGNFSLTDRYIGIKLKAEILEVE